MNKLPQTERLSYLWAAVAVLVAFGVRWFVGASVSDDFTFWFFIPAVAIASWLGGFTPGLLGTALSLAAVFVLNRLNSPTDPTSAQKTGMLLFSISSLTILGTVQGLRYSLRKEIVSRPVVEAVPTPLRRELDRGDRSYKSILDNALDVAIITMDSNRMIKEWSVGATQLTGYTRGEMIGRSADELFTPADLAGQEPGHEQLIAEATGKSAFLRSIQRKDGSTFIGEGSLRTIAAELNSLPGFIKVFTDASARIQKYEDSLESIGRREKDAEVLMYSMAHDMRQYTRGINTNATMIIRDLGSTISEEQSYGLNRLRQNATRLHEMVEGILDHLRLGSADIIAKPVNLSLLGEEAVERLHQTDGAGKIHFIVQPGLWVKGDPELLSLVFDNLFGNAAKYACTGRVVFGHDAVKNAFYVRDEGPGFDPQYKKKIFKIFERLHGQEVQGTGIGLANVMRIIQRHGGDIWAESEQGKGATFFFTLKAADQSPVGSLR